MTKLVAKQQTGQVSAGLGINTTTARSLTPSERYIKEYIEDVFTEVHRSLQYAPMRLYDPQAIESGTSTRVDVAYVTHDVEYFSNSEMEMDVYHVSTTSRKFKTGGEFGQPRFSLSGSRQSWRVGTFSTLEEAKAIADALVAAQWIR